MFIWARPVRSGLGLGGVSGIGLELERRRESVCNSLCPLRGLSNAVSRTTCTGAWRTPHSSKLFQFAPIARWLAPCHAHEVVWEMCLFGERYQKRTRLVTTLPALRDLNRTCCWGHVNEILAGQVRITLPSGRQVWHNRTTLAGAYPAKLCAAWARCVASTAPPDCLGGLPTENAAWLRRLRHAALWRPTADPARRSPPGAPEPTAALGGASTGADCAEAIAYVPPATQGRLRWARRSLTRPVGPSGSVGLRRSRTCRCEIDWERSSRHRRRFCGWLLWGLTA